MERSEWAPERDNACQKRISDYFSIKAHHSHCTENGAELKALTTEAMDSFVAKDEPFCMALKECSGSVGQSDPVLSQNRPFISSAVGTQSISLSKWGKNSKRNMVSSSPCLPSVWGKIEDELHADQEKASTSTNDSTSDFELSFADDMRFYRAGDDRPTSPSDGAYMDSSKHGKRSFCSRGNTSHIRGQCKRGRGVRHQMVAMVPHPSSENEEITEQPDDDMAFESVPDAYFGLLGASFSERESQGHWAQLPDEVLMIIFGFLSVPDLYENISLVCQRWRNLVNEPSFIPWKKLYHKYRRQEEKTVEKVDGMLLNFKICKQEELCVLNFIRCISSIKCLRRMNPEAVLTCLKNHHLYFKAEACMSKMLPDMITPLGTMNIWAVMAVIVLLSDGVDDIQMFMSYLTRPSSTLTVGDVTEALYRMAVLLFAMRENGIKISNRIHYSIFYCLNQMENLNPVDEHKEKNILNYEGDACLRNKSAVKLTHEQRQIVNHEIAPGHVVKIMAFAGTGKTSTLIKYAERRPHFKFLYVTFNKSISVQASRTFPRNVDCKTFHSMAFKHVGKLYQQKGKLNCSKLTPFAVNLVLPEGQAGFIRAKMVAQTIEAFFASADASITTEHVPFWRKDTHGQKVMVDHKEKQFAVCEATKIWNQMKLPFETSKEAYRMTHDGYLKEWQLSKPRLGSFDAIFVDEAQDCTPAIMDVVLSQACGTILVGDPHQQIYTFRGAVNALFEVQHTHIFYLTQSFRFGAEIAYVGATILDVTKNLRNKTLVGGRQKGTINGFSGGQTAILSRTNSCVFSEAVRVTEGERPARIHLIGGPRCFGLDRIRDIWILLQPEVERIKKRLLIKDNFIKMWSRKENGFAALRQYASASEDKELESKIAIVEKFNVRIPELVTRLYQFHSDDPTFADYILGTVHKAKGMEFDTVWITDDFVKICNAKHIMDRISFKLDSMPEDEWNLLYVAVTRAKKHLVMTKSLENLLSFAGEYFLRAELTTDVVKEGTPKCSVSKCTNTVPDNTVLTLRKLPMTTIGIQNDAYLCPSCVEQRLGPYTFLTAESSLVKSMPYTIEDVVMSSHQLLLLQVI
ncbi:F-box DNA helicase 1 isoform X2 [Pleurodeles waltl]|uniref:F-box DNA helicase 1 isoform X2 n=1 Tax=Pleurodeles waltl TaxID=8319 RepID=UPI0037099DCB